MRESCIHVQRPAAPIPGPTLVLSAPSAIGPCENFTADASSTYGGLGRPLHYNWTLENGDGAGFSAEDQLQVEAFLRSLPGSTASVSLPAAATRFADVITIRVTAKNFLSDVAVSELVTVRRVGDPIPRVAAVGGNTLQLRTSDEIRLRVDVD